MRSVCSFAANRAVHPHGRGDNLRRVSNPLVRDGSPPRAWGQCRTGRRNPPAVRFTPTGVGTIATLRGSLRPSAVHPHGRGDNATASRRCSARSRFTPTGVGTMSASCSRLFLRTVHPHGRGDNTDIPVRSERAFGSPPRAWGQSVDETAHTVVIRFTPTGVGTIAYATWAQVAGLGSPPRAWGQLGRRKVADGLARFTPTGVGTICGNWSAASATPVHPHGRGDNAVASRARRWSCRSPPRAWGQCGEFDGDHGALPFTPTGVGTILASQAF